MEMGSHLLLTNLSKVLILKNKQERGEIEKKLLDIEYTMICRLCGDLASHTLFGSACPEKTVKQMERFFKFKILKDRHLPQLICQNCLQAWDSIKQFRKRCKLVQEVLLSIAKRKKRGKLKTCDKESTESSAVNQLDMFNDGLTDDVIDYSDDLIPVPVTPKNDTCEQIYNTDEINLTETINVNQIMSNIFVDCQYCGGCFYDKKEFIKHFKRGECKPRQLLVEEKNDDVKKNIMCEVCGKTFKNNAQLKAHSEYHTDELCYMCDHCPYRGRTRALLIIHLRTHTGYRPHKCDTCGKSFVNASNLNKHKWSHDNSRRFKCKDCGKRFVCENYLKKHIFVNHIGNLRIHRCITCNKGFPNRYVLKKHREKSHTELLGMGIATYLREDSRAKFKRNQKAEEPSLPVVEPKDHSYATVARDSN